MNGKIRLISIIFVLCSLVMVVRLYFLQIVHGDIYAKAAERQYTNKNTVLYDRGDIYFQTKDLELVPAAISRSGFTVSINPQALENDEKISKLYDSLNKILVLDKSVFLSKAQKKESKNEEIAMHVNSETTLKLRALNLYGVTISTDKWRYYPGNRLASQTIGFVAYNDDELAGRYGLERYYEDVLKKDPSSAYNNFFAEFFSNVKETLSDNPKQQGNVITSIEPSVQLFLESEIKNTKDKWSSDMIGGIVIDPTSGEIIAMATNPTFDPNDFKEASVNVFNNNLVEGVYEMGSIIKPITMASGIDSGTVTASSTYFDAGFLFLDKKRISNYDGKGRGVATMQDVLNQSLNTGAAYVAMKMGNKKFAEYMKSFGLGSETGIDLPNEAKGLVDNLDSTRDIEIVTASYGQGIAMTPIETVRALSVLANGGKLVTPHIVKKIEFENGLSKKMAFAEGKQVIKKETSEEISRMLTIVVDKYLRNGTAHIPGYSVAAKTGTAQMTEEGRAGYVEGKYLHSFFGYFPSYNPKFLVFLFHTYPKDVRYASETLTDPFLYITKFLINYYQIPPDRPEDVISQN